MPSHQLFIFHLIIHPACLDCSNCRSPLFAATTSVQFIWFQGNGRMICMHDSAGCGVENLEYCSTVDLEQLRPTCLFEPSDSRSDRPLSTQTSAGPGLQNNSIDDTASSLPGIDRSLMTGHAFDLSLRHLQYIIACRRQWRSVIAGWRRRRHFRSCYWLPTQKENSEVMLCV